MHVAETREKARADVAFGLEKWLYYFTHVAALPLAMEGGDPVDAMIASGLAVIGTPDDAIAQIKRLRGQQGEFGAFLQLAHNWASWDNTIKSYQLWAEHVAPVFKNANSSRQASYDYTMSNAQEFMGKAMQAAGAMIQKHADEQTAKGHARSS
jgi:limonene 1,2-monooxygenase